MEVNISQHQYSFMSTTNEPRAKEKKLVSIEKHLVIYVSEVRKFSTPRKLMNQTRNNQANIKISEHSLLLRFKNFIEQVVGVSAMKSKCHN